MDDTTQYVITAAVLDIARRMRAEKELQLRTSNDESAQLNTEDFLPQALEHFMAAHMSVQSLLAARPPA